MVLEKTGLQFKWFFTRRVFPFAQILVLLIWESKDSRDNYAQSNVYKALVDLMIYQYMLSHLIRASSTRHQKTCQTSVRLAR